MAQAKFAPRRLLIVHAHPDDESLFTGHIIASQLASATEVYLLTLTRGERGKVKLEELKPLEGDLLGMAAFRSQELRNALDEFPGIRHSFAGTRAYRDSGVRLTATGRMVKPRGLDDLALSAVSTSVIADDVLAIMNEFKPDAVLTYNRRGGNGHPDHRMAHEACAMAIRAFGRKSNRRTPAFWVIAEPGEKFDLEIGGPETAPAKKAALEAHASQVAIRDETYSLGNGIETRFDAPERIRRTEPNPLVNLIPILTFFWAIPLGALLGLAGTLLHQVRADNFPLGLVVALAMTGSLLIALRLLRSSRGALYLTSIVFAITVFWLAQEQPGGEVLILGNSIGNTWAYGSIGICALVNLFPSINPASWRQNASGHR